MSNARAQAAARRREAQGPGVNPLDFLRTRQIRGRGASAAPAVGASRADGKLYTGQDYGWQSPQAAANAGLLGSEVTGKAPQPPAAPPAMDFDHGGGRGKPPAGAGGQGARQAPVPIGAATTPVIRNSGASNLNVARQNAANGVARSQAPAPQPAWDWNAPENAAVLAAASGAGTAAAAARAAGQAMPDTSNPASQAYWDRADTRAWEGANPELARRLRERHGMAGGAAEGGQLPFSPNASTGLGAIGETQNFNPDLSAPVVPGLAESMQQTGALPEGFNPATSNFSMPSAPAVAPAGFAPEAGNYEPLPDTAEAAAAQAFNRAALDKIKLVAGGTEEELKNPSYFSAAGAAQYQNPWFPGR